MSKSASTPKKWVDVYPYGTKEGDEISKFFRALIRDPKYTYRSVSAISKTSGLDKERVEEIIEIYATKFKPPLVYQHPSRPDMWGYWELNPDVLKTDNRTLAEKDRDRRIQQSVKS